jgi:hypothetical protein
MDDREFGIHIIAMRGIACKVIQDKEGEMTSQALVPSVAVEKFELIKPNLPEVVQNGYTWRIQSNLRQAIEDAEALWLSMRYGIENQVEIYKAKLVDLYHKDNAEWVHYLVKTSMGYDGLVYHYTNKDTPPTKFKQVISEVWDRSTYKHVKTYYEYEQLDRYKKAIPLHALRVLELLERHNITPDMLWVTTLKKTVSTPKLDPLFMVSFGCWFSATAEWK